jgi:hypothetical protein
MTGVCIDGLRRNMIRSYSAVVEELNDAALSRDAAERLAEKMNTLRNDIVGLCCVFQPNNPDFTDISNSLGSLAQYDPFNEYE